MRLSKEEILNYLKSHKQEFQRRFKLKEIGLFGSFARGEENKDSDIDIFVKMEPNLFNLVALKKQIEKDLKKRVDLIRDHKNIKPFLKKMIEKDIEYV